MQVIHKIGKKFKGGVHLTSSLMTIRSPSQTFVTVGQTGFFPILGINDQKHYADEKNLIGTAIQMKADDSFGYAVDTN